MSTEIATPALTRQTLNGPAMGARWSATFYASADCDSAALQADLAATIEAVEDEMSTWRPTSALMRLNAAPVGAWVAIPRNLATVLDAALAIGRLSDGAFDIGVGDLVTAWGFGGGARAPNANDLRRLTGRASPQPPQTLQIDVAGALARKFVPLTLDLSGIAKGFGVDQMARVMEHFGIASYLVGIDGEMRASGHKPDGSAWSIGHERPDRAARAAMGVLALDNMAVATSGTYRHVVETPAGPMSHTIDPRRGAPVQNGLASVTVLAPTAMLADAWATALLVLGAVDGPRRANAVGLGAIFVGQDGVAETVGL